jgi:hypothetical protein
MRHSYGLRLMPILLLVAVTRAQPVDSLVNEAMRNYPGLKSFNYQIGGGFAPTPTGVPRRRRTGVQPDTDEYP